MNKKNHTLSVHTLPMHLVLLLFLTFLLSGNSEEHHITGLLVNDDGDPVVNHTVELYNEQDQLLASVNTDYQGRFNIIYKPVSSEFEDGPETPEAFRLGSSYPNPFNPQTTIPFEAPKNTNATIAVYNLLGQEVMRTRTEIRQGTHEIVVNLGTGLSQGKYLLHVQGEGFSLTETMTFVSAGISSGRPGISVRSGGQIKSSRSWEETNAGISRRMHVTDDTAPYRIVIEETQAYHKKERSVPAKAHYEFDQPLNVSFKGGEVTDIDGNVYRTVQIGNQEWMAENLRTTKYNDGTSIPHVEDRLDWGRLGEHKKAAYSWYDNDESNKADYGALYNFFAVDGGKLCPAGWNLPGDDDWKQLEMHLGISQEIAGQTGTRGTIEGAMLRATGSRHWGSALGTNETGFSALPAGYRHANNGYFFNAIYGAFFWTATASSGFHGYGRFVTHDLGHITRQTYGNTHGFSVRCMRGAEWHLPTVSTLVITDITHNTAVSGGIVTDDGGATVTERGVVWSTSENPTIQQYEGKTSDETGMGEFSSTLSGLTPETTYYVRAYATNDAGTAYGEQHVFQTLADDDDDEPLDGVTDIDGNTYRTVIIGEQKWMAENLRVTRYRNGDPIPNVVSDMEWSALSTGAWSYLNNDESYDDLYGKLYNWFAVNNPRGLCPDGWQVPGDEDWTELTDYVGGKDIAGKKLKSKTGWFSYGNGTDDFGFSALPGGGRDWQGEFDMHQYESIWWTSTEYDAEDAWQRGMYFNSNGIEREHYIKTDGMYIRCLRADEQVHLPKTEKTYHENFQTNDETGWAFMTSDGDVSVQNNELRFSTGDDDIVHMLLPIEATKDDFSFRVVPGSLHQRIESGGFGRAGFKSVITLHIEDELSVMYTEDILSHADGELTTLATYPIPDNLSSMQLDASREGNNMHIRAYVNDLLFYSGTLQNVDEGLFSGQMVMYIHRDEEETGPADWSLDEVKIDYIPYLDVASSFQDNFTNIHTPWFRSGDPDIVAQSITIANDRLNFNATNGTDLNVLSPVGPVQDFSIEVQGGAEGSHNADFGISRIFDYQNYVTVFFDEDELFLGYALDSYDPEILDEVSIPPGDVSKLKFSGQQTGTDLQLSVWANDNLVLTGTIPNVPQKLATGHLAISYWGGNVVNSWLDNVVIEP